MGARRSFAPYGQGRSELSAFVGLEVLIEGDHDDAIAGHDALSGLGAVGGFPRGLPSDSLEAQLAVEQGCLVVCRRLLAVVDPLA
jgi:hypothetical protein